MLAPTLEGAELVAFVATTDLARSHAFYGGLLGLLHVETTPFANVYDVGGTSLRVTLVEQRAPAPYTVLGWQVPDIAATVAWLAAEGVTLKRFEGMGQDESGIWRAPGGARIAWFEDPDGNILSVGQMEGFSSRALARLGAADLPQTLRRVHVLPRRGG